MKRGCQLIAVIGLSLIGVSAAWAADSGSIAINPFSQVIAIHPGQTGITANFDLVNDSSVKRTFEVTDVDFGSLRDTGGLIFSGENSTELQKKYGLTKWLSIASPVVEVGAHKTVSIPVTILNRDDLAPGGHYGAIIFTERADPVNGQVNLHAAITSLLFLQKLGGEKYGLSLDSLKRDGNWSLPQSATLRLHNTGNIDVVPRGVVRVLDPRGREVARSAINEDSSRILPETFRTLSVNLFYAKRPVLPGRYKLEVSYRYDGSDAFTTVGYNIYYANVVGLVVLLVIAVLILALVFGSYRLSRKFISRK